MIFNLIGRGHLPSAGGASLAGLTPLGRPSEADARLAQSALWGKMPLILIAHAKPSHCFIQNKGWFDC